MATWGYRIYTFNFKYGHQELPLGEHDVRETFLDLLEDVASRNILRGLPVLRADQNSDGGGEVEDEDQYEIYSPSTPILTIKNCERRSDQHIHLIVGVGDAGLHEDLSDPETQTRTNIQKQAAEVSLRLDILFPDEGQRGVIISETQGMRDPVSRLIKWMTYCWRERKELLLRIASEERDQWITLDKEGSAVGSKPTVPQLRNHYIKTSRLTDPELIKTIIRESKERAAELFELRPDGNRKHTLTRKLNTSQEIDSVGKLLETAFGSGRKDLAHTPKGAVLEFAGELGYDTEELANGGIGVEDAKVRLKPMTEQCPSRPNRFPKCLPTSSRMGVQRTEDSTMLQLGRFLVF